MNGKAFVDTNILVYAHDRAAGDKHTRARELVESLWQTRSGVISTQILQELAVNLRRKVTTPLDVRSTSDIVTDYLTWQVITNDGNSILTALKLQDRYQLSFWDALVVAAAQLAEVTILYSEDLADGQRLGSVRVINPLVG